MSKSDIRALLIELKPFLKLKTFCDLAEINNSTLSLFMRDPQHDYTISQEKLDLLVDLIMDFMSNFA